MSHGIYIFNKSSLCFRCSTGFRTGWPWGLTSFILWGLQTQLGLCPISPCPTELPLLKCLDSVSLVLIKNLSALVIVRSFIAETLRDQTKGWWTEGSGPFSEMHRVCVFDLHNTLIIVLQQGKLCSAWKINKVHVFASIYPFVCPSMNGITQKVFRFHEIL